MTADYMMFLLLILGFVLLIKGADWLVDGASAVAKRFKIPDIVIGLTIVAFGTSAPELIVNLFASFQGNTEIAIGNIVGSNIANIFLILGVAGIIYPLTVKSNTVWKEIPLSLLAALVLGFMANDALLDGREYSVLSRIDGLILLSFFVIFLYYTALVAKNNREKSEQAVEEMSFGKSTLFIILGLIGLAAGGKLVVDSAVAMATWVGISQAVIGLTVVAIGTSLPELMTSAIAAFKRKADIAIGNVVGSNIFNIFWILGISAFIRPLPFNPTANIDVIMVVLASFMLFIWMFIGKKHILQRWQSAAFLAVYGLYMVALVMRG